MTNIIKFFLVLAILSLTFSAFAQESHKALPKVAELLPQPNCWPVLVGTPLKTTNDGNKQVDIFRAEPRRPRAPNYAWVTGALLDDTCMVIIWVRREHEDKRIVYEAKKENNLCTIYISNSDFENHFKYCVLSGISTESGKGFRASFGGGPAGDRDQYWFERGDPVYVKPDFYCPMK